METQTNQSKQLTRAFTLEIGTSEQLEAESNRIREQREKREARQIIREMQESRLSGKSLDVMQGKLFAEDQDLFSGPAFEMENQS